MSDEIIENDFIGRQISRYSRRLEMEAVEDWHSWRAKIPSLNFKESWAVKIIPPFAGAMARFIVENPETKRMVSVYLDCFDRLGVEEGPYWEMYLLGRDSDLFRFKMEDTDSLMKTISSTLDPCRVTGPSSVD